MAILCSNCEFDNPAGMNFCGKCGTPLSAEPTHTPERSVQEFSGVMVGPDLLERFRKAGLEAKGEKRKVTALFADLTDYTAISERIDGEDLYGIIQKYIRLLMECVYRYEGMVDKILGDGILALFGAPIAHENDTERAIRSAMDMQEALKRFNWELSNQIGQKLQVHIGLNSGTVIAGGIGLDNNLDYTVIGDTVNLAQRIGSIAEPDTIFVSEKVYHQTRKLFDFEKQAPTSLKGIEKPVRTYRLMGPKARPEELRGIKGMRTPLIGRQTEYERLRQAVDNAIQKQRGELMLVAGEAGIGKSRLVLELKNHLKTTPLQILEGRSLTYRRSIPYWIFIELLRGYFGIHGELADAEIRTRLSQKTSQTLGEYSKDVLPFLEHLLSLSPSRESYAERLRYLDGEQLRQQIFLAVKELWVAEARRQPLFLIMEDLHWADEASIELLVFLLNSLRDSSLILCGISRSFSEDGLKEIVTQATQRLPGHFNQIQIQPLSEDESSELFSQLVGPTDLPKPFVQKIIRRSSGNPLFMEELLRMLIDTRQIIKENGTWQLGKEGETIGIPDTLEALALTRFDRLLPEDRRIVQIASVIGRDFDVKVLSKVANVTYEKKLEAILATLTKRGFVDPKPKTEKQSYMFRHVITSDAIYGTLLRKERQELHAAVGAALETVYADKIDERIELLARHYSWSSNLERALHYLILAGEKATRAYVNNQARGHYEQALDLLPRVEHTNTQAIQVYMGLADGLLFAGEYKASQKHYYKALEIVERASDLENPLKIKIDIYRKIGMTFERQGDFQEALTTLEKAQVILSELDVTQITAERARIQNDIGWLHFRQGNIELAEKFLLESLELVEGTSHYSIVASIFNRLGGVYYQKDELDKASNYVRKSLVLREEIGDITAVARSYNNLGLLNWKQGNWDRALKNFEQSVEINESLGDVEAIISLHSNMGLLQTDRGELQAAKEHLSEGLELASQIGHNALKGEVCLHYSHYWLAVGEWEKSLDQSRQSIQICSQIGAQESLVDAYWCHGEAWLRKGEIEKAVEAVEKSFVILDKVSVPHDVPMAEKGRLFRLLGDISLERGNLGQAEKYLKQSSEQFSLLDNQLELGRTTIVFAQLAKAQGDRIGTRLREKEARLIFQKLGAQLDLEKLAKCES